MARLAVWQRNWLMVMAALAVGVGLTMLLDVTSRADANEAREQQVTRGQLAATQRVAVRARRDVRALRTRLNGRLTGANIRNGTIGRVDLDATVRAALDRAAVPGPTGATGLNGATGLTGPTGAPGPQGPAGTVAGVSVQVETVPVPDGQSASVQATCPAGQIIVGGGTNLSAFLPDVFILSSRPTRADGGTPVDGEALVAWRSSAINPAGGTGAVDLNVWAICAS